MLDQVFYDGLWIRECQESQAYDLFAGNEPFGILSTMASDQKDREDLDDLLDDINIILSLHLLRNAGEFLDDDPVDFFNASFIVGQDILETL